jgi:hypothetical protein
MIRSPVEFARYKRLRLFQEFFTNVAESKLGPVINQPAGGLTGATPLTPHLTFGRSRQEGCTRHNWNFGTTGTFGTFGIQGTEV